MRRVLVRKIAPAFPSKPLLASCLRRRNTRRFRRHRCLFGHESRLLHREMKRALVEQSCPWVVGAGCWVPGAGCWVLALLAAPDNPPPPPPAQAQAHRHR
ncbi:hypothetical protein GCM10009095_02300 [Sphingomonas molluscorum]|nr:hypothetical protein GCM10017606_12740 [Microbacterium terregens]